MKNSEAVTKICPFISSVALDGANSGLIRVCCKTSECMAWENIPKGRDVKEEDKEGYCKRLGK